MPIPAESRACRPPGHEQAGLAWLALLPMALALAGAFLDERAHLGYTTWRSACRAAGLSPASLATFTLELLPRAVIGALAGGVLVLIAGMLLRRRGHMAHCALAAHGGCLLAMALGLWLCTTALPLPWLLVTEGLLAMAFARGLSGLQQGLRAAASVRARTGAMRSA